MTPREYLCSKYGMKTDAQFSICYRPWECGSLVESYSIDKAVEMLEKDIQSMREFLACYDIDPCHAEEATYKIWDKHLVVW